jgi:hypothetical protein
MPSRLARLAAAASLALAASAGAIEEPPGTAGPNPSHRSLNGHRFMPTETVDSPFSVTSAGMSLVLGIGSAVGPTYVIVPGDPPTLGKSGTRDYSFAGGGGYFRYDQRLADWILLRARLGWAIFSGIDGPSAIAVGASVRPAGSLGVTVGRDLGDTFRIAALVDLDYSPQFGLMVAEALAYAIENQDLEAGEAFQQDNVLTVQPGIAVSWAPQRALGLTGTLQYLGASLDTQEESLQESGYLVGLLADLDLGALTRVPVGVALGARRAGPLGSSDLDTIRQWLLAVQYTGRADLAIGVEMYWQTFRVRPELDSDVQIAEIVMRYFW